MSIAPSRPPVGAPVSISATAEAPRATGSDTHGRVNDVTGAASQRARSLDLAGSTVLLATDGLEEGAASAHVALALARKYGAVVRVVNVHDLRSVPVPVPLNMVLSAADDLVGNAVHEEQEREVRAALSRTTGRAIDWPVRIMLGSPANCIVREAQHVEAVLIIMGLRQHGRLDRALGDETTLNVMRNAECPVLGIVAGATTLPRRVLGAIDFSDTSLVAARTALAVVGDDAELVLAYVPPLTERLPDDGESVIHDLGVEAGLARTVGELGDGNISLDHVVLLRTSGETSADALLACADTMHIDLIAAGSARHGQLERWVMGSVSTDLVRDGRRSVLIVPPRTPTR